MTSQDKAEFRKRLWKVFEDNNLLRTAKPAQGRIPNFKVADQAAQQLEPPQNGKDHAQFSTALTQHREKYVSMH
jgi:hypothetical protein